MSLKRTPLGNGTCPICNLLRSRSGGHPACSKEMQRRTAGKKQSRNMKTLSVRNTDGFVIYMGSK